MDNGSKYDLARWIPAALFLLQNGFSHFDLTTFFTLKLLPNRF